MIGTVIIVYNLPVDVFLLQLEAIKKYCKDEDNVIEIFDNSTETDLAENIRYHCEIQNINYYKIFSTSKNSSDSHAWAATFAYQKLRDTYSKFLFLDHDCIPVKPYSINEILSGGHILAGIGQGALKKYLWVGCLFINNEAIDKDLVDFYPSQEWKLDSGGNLYRLIEKHGMESCLFFNESYHQNPYFFGQKYSHYSMINNEMFCHFVNSSQWNPTPGNADRLRTLINIVKEKTGL